MDTSTVVLRKPQAGNRQEVKQVHVQYYLYARKSIESEERQVLSIDSQIKEMMQMAERENLEIVEIKRESQSAKETAQRPIFNEAKLENDNLGINVKRGLRTRCEMGLWPGYPPLGYLNQKRMDKKCELIVDPARAPVIKQIFEKVANEKWSGRQVYIWLKFKLNFYTRGNKSLTLSGIYRILDNRFYYGLFEYPRKSDNWYEGKHTPLITQELWEKAQAQLTRDNIVRENKEFAFTKLFTCGYCESGISAEEKWKPLKDGTSAHYIYYGCSRARDRNCKNKYIREEELIEELLKIIDKVNINEPGMRMKLEDEIRRFNKLQKIVNGRSGKGLVEEDDVNIRQYAKYLLKDGSVSDKRELLANLRSKLLYKDKKITMAE